MYIDQLRVIDKETNDLVEKEEYLCYFKLTEPTPFILGELIKENGFPKIFTSINEAIGFAQKHLQQMFVDEE